MLCWYRGFTVTFGADPQWSPGPIKCPRTVNCCCVGGEGGNDKGRAGIGGDTDTELVEALVSDGVGFDW